MTTTAGITRFDPPTTSATDSSAASILMTPQGLHALRRELDLLQAEIEVELPRRLRQAREFGEASGNDDYLQIREEEAVIAARIAGLRRTLAAATVADPSEFSTGSAGIGSLVTIRSEDGTFERRLVGGHEPTGSDGMSAASPVGRAIIGKRPGDEVDVEMPSGEIRSFAVLAVRPD